ncbi:MAG: radical SAM protein [Acidobacteriota bacterium]
MATVALVNPQLATSGWGRGLRPGTMEDALPRHALTMLAAVLRRAGHRVVLADLRLLSGWHDYDQILARERPQFVCVTAHTVEIATALACCERAKKVLPDCITAAGGIHLTMFPEEAPAAVDHVLRGEGEVSLPRLIAGQPGWPRVSWGEPPDLDALPFEDRELYPDYARRTRFPLWSLPAPTVDLLTGRGCPFGCRFCCGPGEQNLYTQPSPSDPSRRIPSLRRRSVANVIAELEALSSRYQMRSAVFHDDQFLLAPRWVLDFCEALHRTGFVRRKLRWWAACRADVICRYPEVIAAMRRAGLKVISIGFESFNDAILDWLAKGTTCEQNFRAAEICHQLGLEIFANVMLGIPRPDGSWALADDRETLAAIEKIRPRYVSPSFFTPAPGSWLYDWWRSTFPAAADGGSRFGRRDPGPGAIPGVDYSLLATLASGCVARFSHPLHDRLRHLRFRFASRRAPRPAPALVGGAAGSDGAGERQRT